MAGASFSDEQVHGSPTMRVNGSWDAYRSGSTVYVNLNLSINMRTSQSYTDANYGVCVFWNGNMVYENSSWIQAPARGPLTNWDTSSISFNDNSSGTIEVIGYCYDDGIRDHCDKGWPSHSLGSTGIGPGYHSLSDITVSGTAISRHNQSRSVTVSGNAYPSESSSLYVKIGSGTIASYSGTDSGYEKSPSFTPSSFSVSEGSSYTVTATRYHVSGSYGSKTGSKTFYTYRKPTVDNLTITPGTKYSPQDKLLITWTTNSYRWGSYESNFQTTGKFNNSSISGLSQNPTGGGSATSVSHTLTESDIYAKLTNTQLNNNASFTTPIEINRINPSASNWTATGTKNVTCQIQPVLAPASVSATDGVDTTNLLGRTIFIQEVPTLTLDWTYSKFNGAAGVVDGYKVEVYLDSSYLDLFSTFDVYINHTSSTWIAELGIDTATELKRGVKNYFKITPYYKRPDGSKLYGTESYTDVTKGWVIPIYALNPPRIDYPKNGSTWHNKYFRILLQSPEDLDMDSYSQAIQDTYTYKDIQIEITADNTSYTLYYSDVNHNKIFSTSNLIHMKYIGINLSLLSNFINANKYTFRIRFQKNYYGDTWGIWSDYIVVNNTPVTNLNLIVGQTITSAQYTYVRDASMRLYGTYPFNTQMIEGNIAQDAGEQIDASEYQAIYNTVKGIQVGINNYCVYDNDRQNVSMLDIINALDNPNQPRIEFITANRNPPDKAGRNYKNILIDCMNQLK